VIPPFPRVLVLGSLPGVASITAGRYYAHPRNLFWDFMGELFGAGPALDYDERLARLGAAGVALWDVLAEGERPGSLDASIELATAAHNDIAALLQNAPGITCIACNGALAATLFRRRILPTLGAAQRGIPLLALPSTSPANASLTRAAKLERWRALQRAAAAAR
jgi:double-stranded uracil-DNA glycosylase